METLKLDRRATGPQEADSDQPDSTKVVKQGILIQACIGTIGAVEFLKAHDIDGTVIQRVLTSAQVREDDHTMPAQSLQP